MSQQVPAEQLLIALDVDGTILHHDGHLSRRVADAIGALRDAGAHIVIATGRSAVATMPIIEELGLVREGGIAVCSNGAITLALDPEYDEGYRVTEAVTFDPRPAVELLREARPDALVAVEEVGVGFKLSAPFPDGELQGDLRIVDHEELVSSPATRVTFRDPNGSAESFSELVDRIGLHGVNYAVGFTAWLDLAPEGVSKGSALEQVRRQLHIEPSCTIAVGDQRNDLEMLGWAARGVAMGQAPPEVIAVADETTAPVEEDGLAVLLEQVASDLLSLAATREG
ncbi:HAD family hydrolase [Ornithinimicrobium cavernae]|uniref:HAD family hydrolase n=1 Tax=Ornithinimicrobium cavernae TaxID=2666047 RepID=UPI000D699355|nr:HAD family hydrolase [Ornithinimicrobium cavernae]